VATQVDQNGEFQVLYSGPWKGIDVQHPENLIDPAATPASNDFIFRNAELRSRPAFNPTFLPAPPIGANNIIVMVAPIPIYGNTIGGNNYEIVAAGSGGVLNNIYTLRADNATWMQITGGFVFVGGILPYIVNWKIFSNILYMVQGGMNHLPSWAGISFVGTPDNATIGGNTTGAVFLDELDQHLIMASTLEGGTQFLNRVRWSQVGVPNVWDPTVNVNAGFNSFIDVPDVITGVMMLGRVGYIFRTNGITEMDPTGIGTAPFDFNHLWASQIGIGNVFINATAQYGTTGVFVSLDNIYAVQSYQIVPIGGTARDAIFADLSLGSTKNFSGQFPSIIGTIVPFFRAGLGTSLSNVNGANGAQGFYGGSSLSSFIYLVYLLFIPMNTGTKVWVYSFEEQNWTDFFLPGVWVTGRPSVAPIVDSPNVLPISIVTQTMLIPIWNISAGTASIGAFNPMVFDDPVQGSSHSFKVEDIVADRVPTVRRVVLTYRDLGPSAITATISGSDDNGVPQSITSPLVTLGTASATGKLLTKFIDITFTAFRPQLTINRAAGGGPVSIATAIMLGRVERGTL
jgi:hypothetical protein